MNAHNKKNGLDRLHFLLGTNLHERVAQVTKVYYAKVGGLFTKGAVDSKVILL